MSYEEEDTCMSYEEENTCMSYEEEDTCMTCLYERYGDPVASHRWVSSSSYDMHVSSSS
jgi:hypothetical protein